LSPQLRLVYINLCTIQFSSVQLQILCFMQSYSKDYDGCAEA